MEIEILASGSSGNCYKISDGKTKIFLDCGIPFKEILRKCNFKISDIDGCLITHHHQDHVKGAKELAEKGVTLYMASGEQACCELADVPTVRIEALRELDIGSFRVMPFDVQHDTPEPLGFLITSKVTGENLVYFTDTFYVKYRFNKIHYLLGECNYSKQIVDLRVKNNELHQSLLKRLYTSHMSLETFLKFIKANDLSEIKKIYLLHLSDKNSDELQFKKEVQAATGAEVYVC